jgi:sialic acid synthase SpsE/radical SAM superfamily enzyme YgiQ (UPF0313 family)
MDKKSYDVVLIFPPIRVWDNPRNFPTGLGLITARLRNAGYRVKVIDANGLRLDHEEVLDKITEYNPAIIGIGGLITTYGWIKHLAARIKQARPETPLVLGGSVGTSIIETALKNLDVDIIAIGEADHTILELTPALLNGETDKLEHISGLAFQRDGEMVTTAPREMIENLDELPFPAWDMFPMQVYLENPVVGVGRDIDIISSRGCPFPCAYCYRIFGRQYRTRSAEHVVGEIEALKHNYDVDFISFQDDCFVIDKQRVYDICDLIDHNSALRSLRWSCTGRVTVCDKDMLQRMRASGCVSVSYGIESGSEIILRNMRKNAGLDKAKQAICNTRAAGLRCPVSFMIGYPGETPETVQETVEFCKELNIPLTALMFTCPYPGTELYEQVKDTETFREQFANEEEFVRALGDAVDLTVNLTEMGNEELVKLRDEALQAARKNYVPPSEEEVQEQERQLYGEELYRKAQQQLRDPRMQAHRKRHGFNEKTVDSGKIKTGPDQPGWIDGSIKPYLIAEAGVNHDGELPTALELVDAAKEAGADCVKFQAFSADDLAVKDAPKAPYQTACGDEGESQYEMLKRYELSEEDFRAVFQHCRERKIDFLATPFSVPWVQSLTRMGVTAFKIGSGNIEAVDLLNAIGRTNLPVIMSTGMSDMAEVERALDRLRAAGCGELAVLHCVSLYPTRLEQANLSAIRTLAEATDLPVGFSDHTEEEITGALAVAAGAGILEKHLTLDKNRPGPDHKMSMEPHELWEYIKLARAASTACGTGTKKPRQEELDVKKTVRLSAVSTIFLKAGTIITKEMITSGVFTAKRPGDGYPADQIHNMINSTVVRDINPDEIVRNNDLEPNTGW